MAGRHDGGVAAFVEDEADVAVDAGGPHAVVGALDAVELEAGEVGLELQVEGRRLHGRLLAGRELGQAVEEGLGDVGGHGTSLGARKVERGGPSIVAGQCRGCVCTFSRRAAVQRWVSPRRLPAEGPAGGISVDVFGRPPQTGRSGS